MSLDEPGVAITDFLLAVQTGLLLILLIRARNHVSSKGRWFAALFFFLTFASILGGILHGFFNAPVTSTHMNLWKAVLLCIGAISVTLFNLVPYFLPELSKRKSVVSKATIVAFCVYSAYIFTGYRTFLCAILFYLPATLLLLCGTLRAYTKTRAEGSLSGTVGLVLTLVAAVVQQIEFYVDPYILNHDTMYHIVQGVAIFMLYRLAVKSANQNSLPDRGSTSRPSKIAQH